MRRSLLLFALSGTVLAPSAQAAIHPQAGTAGAPSLAQQTGVRLQGMGNAFMGHTEDVNSLYGNPAGTAFLDHKEFTTMHRRLFEGISQSNFGVVFPFTNITSSNIRHLGTLGMGVSYSDYGNMPGRDTLGNTASDFSADDWIIQASYAKTVGRNFAAGVNAKFYRFGIADVRADGGAFDVGAQYKFDRWVTLGAAATNLGGAVRYHSADSKLPTAYGGGISVAPFYEKLTVAMDVTTSDFSDPRYKAGVESWLNSVIALRAGYDSVYDAGTGLTAGLGLRVEDLEVMFFPIRRLALDYAFMPSSEAGDLHFVSLTFRFGDH